MHRKIFFISWENHFTVQTLTLQVIDFKGLNLCLPIVHFVANRVSTGVMGCQEAVTHNLIHT
jgi:hypothetical protein